MLHFNLVDILFLLYKTIMKGRTLFEYFLLKKQLKSSKVLH